MNSDLDHVHRRSPRTSRRIPIQVALKYQGQDKVCYVNTVNFSKTGLRVQSNLSLEPGQALVALPGRSGAPHGYYRVVWTDGRDAGLEFVN